MCGICGFIDFTCRSNVTILNNMVSTLHHRGPDDKGCDFYTTNDSTIGLGHSRLAIIDISKAGHQPMKFEDISIVLNGEIYNYKELRSELYKLGHLFNSESDTEVVLHAFLEWGHACVSKFIGMFSIVILNKRTKEITLIRDRAGIKPLYFYWHNGLFLFASELKAFHKHPGFIKKIRISAVQQFMNFAYIPSPNCIFENSNKLDPGHILTFNIDKRDYKITKYWDVKDYYCLPSLKLSYLEAKNEMERILISAFEYRMISDVPVGVFLSGGYDSTAVTALLQSNRTEKLKTFTIGFHEGNNEALFAKGIARHLGTDHFEYYCKTKEAQEIIPDLPYYYDEPFGDSSAIPTMLVSKMARKTVTVALSADAGDEIFAGYKNHRTFLTNLNLINKIPIYSRKSIQRLAKIGIFFLPESFTKHKLTVLSDILCLEERLIPQNLMRLYTTIDKSIRNNLFNSKEIFLKTIYDDDFSGFKDILSIALGIDYILYLQNDILAKVDRATMSVSLEGREPFLDHRIIEFAAQLPSDFKYGLKQKMILRDIVHKYVPENLMDRPKTGFTVPIYSWLKNDLSYLLEENLNITLINNSGLFNAKYVQKLKSDFEKDRLYDPTIIWKLLQFQMWYNTWIN